MLRPGSRCFHGSSFRLRVITPIRASPDPKHGGRLIGDVMKTHKGQVEAGDVKRIAEELLTP